MPADPGADGRMAAPDRAAMSVQFTECAVVVSVTSHQTVMGEEWRMYRIAKKKSSIAEYQAYLRAFPKGRYVSDVKSDLDALNIAEYRACISFMASQAIKYLRMANEYTNTAVALVISGDDYGSAMETKQEEMEIKGVLKDLSRDTARIDTFLQYGADADPRFSEIHDSTVELFHAYLTLQDLTALPPVSISGYQQEVSAAFDTFLQMRQLADSALSKLDVAAAQVSTEEALKARRAKIKKY